MAGYRGCTTKTTCCRLKVNSLKAKLNIGILVLPMFYTLVCLITLQEDGGSGVLIPEFVVVFILVVVVIFSSQDLSPWSSCQ